MASQQLTSLVSTFRNMTNPPQTHEEWRAAWDAITRQVPVPPGTSFTPVEGGIAGAWIASPESKADRVLLHFHGGAFALGSARNHLAMLGVLAKRSAGRVLSVDYRLAPEHPFPAAQEDALAAYRWLLESGISANDVVVMGDSCGAALALGMLFDARDGKLPMPAGVVCLSPWIDLTQSGDSMIRNQAHDVFLQAHILEHFAVMYAGEADRSSPRLSPLHGDYAGLPPIFIQAGGSEVLLSDALRLADVASRAHVPVTLEIWPHVLHEWHVWANEVPEAAAALERVGAFVYTHTHHRRQ